MTDSYFFDTDCLSAFLWVKNESILAKLYPGKIILPMQVYDEIKKVPPLIKRVELMRNNNQLSVESIMTGTEEYNDYYSLAICPNKGVKIIGRGEAATIALKKKYDGILASNNLSDIMTYVEKYNLKHITTGEILVDALAKNIITESEGNTIWQNMLAKKRMLPANTFTEYLTNRDKTI